MEKQDRINKILELFVNNNLENPLLEVNNLSSNDLAIHLKYFKYNKSITAPVAKIIVGIQNSLYKVAALSTKGKADARLLDSEIKKELELVFEVTKGSTELKSINDILSMLKKILEMIPEKHRATTLVAIVLILTVGYSYESYLETDERRHLSEIELQKEKINAETTKKAFEILH